MNTLNIRGIDEDAMKGIKLAAGARGMTIGEYVAGLYRLHRILVNKSMGDDNDFETLNAAGFLYDAGLPIIHT